MSKSKMLFKYFVVTCVTLMCISITICALMVFTHAGNLQLISLIKRIEPRLVVEIEQGTITQDPIFKVIRWQDQQSDILLENVSYTFDWSCLIDKVCLKQLRIGSGEVNISSVESKGTNNNPSPVLTKLPIDFIADEIIIENISFNINQTKGNLGRLKISATGKETQLDVAATIANLKVNLADKREPTTQSSPINFGQPLIEANSLPKIVSPFNIKLMPLKITDLVVSQANEQLIVINALTTEARFNDSTLRINKVELNTPETDLNLIGQIAFNDHYPLQVEIDGNIKSVKQLQPENLLQDQKYSLKIEGDLSKLNTQLSLTNKIDLQLSSELNLLERYLPFKVDTSWQSLDWPLTGKPTYSSDNGSIHIEGDLKDYFLSVNSKYHAEGIPKGDIVFAGNGDLHKIHVQQFLVNTLEGSANLVGLLEWKEGIKWQGLINLNNLNLAQLQTDYTGNISGSFKQEINISHNDNNETNWAFTIPTMDIKGQMLNQPISVNGNISGNNIHGINVDNVAVLNGKNKITIDGEISKKSNLKIDLNLIELGNLHPDASGHLKGKVEVLGEKQSLNIIAKLKGGDLNFQSNQLESVDIESNVILEDSPSIRLQLEATNALVSQNKIEQIQLSIENIEPANSQRLHQVNLSIKDPQNSVNLRLQVKKQKDLWSSKLTQGRIKLSDYLLELDSVVDFIPNNKQLLVSSHCWDISNTKHAEQAKLCAENLNIGGNGHADITVDAFPLASLNSFSSEPLSIKGKVAADAKIQWSETSEPQFDIKVDGKEVAVQIDSEKDSIIYPIEQFTIKLLNQGGASDLNAVVSSPNLLETNITAQLSADRKLINGIVDIDMPELSKFKALSTQIEKLSGALNAQFKIVGKLQKPNVDGNVAIKNSTLYATGVPIRINDFNSNIIIKNNSAELKGSFTTEKFNEYRASSTLITKTINLLDKSVREVGGAIANSKEFRPKNKASITGALNWQDKLQGSIHIVGQQITVNDYEQINLIVSPDLFLTYRDALTLSGAIKVDKGSITVSELAKGGTAVSKDVIVIDEDVQSEAKTLPIIVDLNVDLGDLLKIKALGLDSIIGGNLKLQKSKLSTPSLFGTLILSDGSYTVLSQELILQESEITFQGPLENPYINIKAIRSTENTEDDVTAGVLVTGAPDDLAISVFSEPSMSQQEALSYLVQGQSLENSSGSNSQVTNMLLILQLSAANSFGILNKVGNQLGIENLSVSSSGTGDQQSVGLSGYIAPRVQISYGIGVFDNFAKFAIRYEMFEDFYIEASTGLTQAIDAYYQFDLD